MSGSAESERDGVNSVTSAHERERKKDEALVGSERNTARFFSENRQVAWVALLMTLLWGVFGYMHMPKAKDPTIEIRQAVAVCSWPGADATRIEDLVTRKLEQKLAESANIEKLESISRTGVSLVYVTLKTSVTDRSKEWNDLQNRLETIRDLPSGAGPIVLQKDFGDTATLMLTVSGPSVSEVELDLRAEALQKAIAATRAGTSGTRATLVVSHPPEISTAAMVRVGIEARAYFDVTAGTRDARTVQSPGFLGLDVETTLDDAALRARLREFVEQRLRLSELHPDVWRPVVVRDLATSRTRLAEVAGERFSHHELDLYTDTLARYLQAVPLVSKVTRSGVLPEQINLEYSQQRLAAYGLEADRLAGILAARNITAPGGEIEASGKMVTIAPSGELRTPQQIGDIAVATNAKGAPVYLRDLVEISRDYQSPARYLNYISVRRADGTFETHRAITLSVNMRAGEQIGEFQKAVDAQLAVAARLLPPELSIRRTSDQPLQVKENVDLFMTSLYEAIALVVVVALIGFWEWRTALLLALAIPITLSMSFGLMSLFGIDVQQISIASLIIALGLLVDDPVVASDAIKHSIGAGWKPTVAAWLGPTKLATAIMFATVTNIAAYLPFLTLSGDTGKFIFSLPVVLTLSLVASRVVSMTFVPLLGGSLLRPSHKPEPTRAERRSRGFGKVYVRAVTFAIEHRFLVFGASLLLLLGGGAAARSVPRAFFPKDLSYLSYVDIWLPEDATFGATREKAEEVRKVIAETAEAWGKTHGHHPNGTLVSMTSFVGGGGPRFWFSAAPEQQQLNYAELILQVADKEDTAPLVPVLQAAVSRRVPGARVDVRQLESGKPVGVPVSIRLSGENVETLRGYAEEAKAILRRAPGSARVRDDWGADTFSVKLEVDPDRANLAGVTNLDVARSSAASMNGAAVGKLREGDREIPIVVRLRAEERAQLRDVQDLWVNAQGSAQKVPLHQISKLSYSFATEKIRRRNQFRTITVSAFPAGGVLSSQVLEPAMPALRELEARLPPGYKLEIGGEHEEQVKSFAEMGMVTALMLAAIYAALVVQFRHAIKPLIVFAALPYGVVAALVALVVTGAPLGFMALLGIISLMGVIVSHIIVLFDFIEEMREEGEPMHEALVDAGLMRLRPVLVTVVATVLGLFPLAVHGGPLWEPLCYAQIGGLTFATVITLVLVPVLYTIAIEDLRWIPWRAAGDGEGAGGSIDAARG